MNLAAVAYLVWDHRISSVSGLSLCPLIVLLSTRFSPLQMAEDTSWKGGSADEIDTVNWPAPNQMRNLSLTVLRNYAILRMRWENIHSTRIWNRFY